MRSGPGTDQPKLETVPSGRQFVKLGEENDWTKILFNGQEAFIKTEYVKELTQ
ncbi:MAG: SH3 domain-containing protein [Lachnospiraceae bacterium]|nr:SH3 domain-containing protein [Lachnospiraceae bacterium]